MRNNTLLSTRKVWVELLFQVLGTVLQINCEPNRGSPEESSEFSEVMTCKEGLEEEKLSLNEMIHKYVCVCKQHDNRQQVKKQLLEKKIAAYPCL